MKTLNERATEILKALLAVRAKKLKIKNASQTIHVKLHRKVQPYFADTAHRNKWRSFP